MHIKTDVIIPVYKPDAKFEKLLKRLHAQTVKPNRIILINTGKQYFDEYFGNRDICREYGDIVLKHISEEEFDHGGSRRLGVSLSDAEAFIFMTDDALPVDCRLIEKLTEPIADKSAALAYARQLAGKDADRLERLTRRFNYPAESFYKSREDIEKLGIKAFFCPNVCAAYDRKVYDELGGFEEHMIFNEDMVYARHLIDAGYRIAYRADARVLHYHDYNGSQQFKRNFDLGVSHAMFPEVFSDVPPGGEGVKMVKTQALELMHMGAFWDIFRLGWLSACKMAGYQLGKRYKKLPEGVIGACTMNRRFWK